MLVHVENFRHREMMKGPSRKDGFEGIQKFGLVLEVKSRLRITCMERVGIEIKIDSMQNDGSQSWIVISRGVNKYVTELPEKNEKLIHYEEVASSTE